MAEDWERLAQLFHGLRTPLNGMIGYSKLILEEVVDDPQEEWEFLQEAYQLALHLLSIK
jgi:signal transduction histidine kinase